MKKTFNIRQILIMGAIITLTTSYDAGRSLATATNNIVTRYKVSSRGFTIGNVTTTQQIREDSGNTLINFETNTNVKAAFLWVKHRQETIEKGILKNGELVSYSHSGQENKQKIQVEGKLASDGFRFVTTGPDGSRTLLIPRSSYDFTTMECPEARLDFKGRKQVTLRILDVEKLMVVKREYRLIDTTNYALDGTEYPCRVIDFADPHKKVRRWVAWTGASAVVYRQDGSGNATYSVQATSTAKW